MDIVQMNHTYESEVYEFAKQSYETECSYVDLLDKKAFHNNMKSIKNKMNEAKGLVCLNNNKVEGFLLYYEWMSENTKFVNVPLWGYGAKHKDRIKIMSRLIEELMRITVCDCPVQFHMKVYAHDEDVFRCLVWCQFGAQSLEGIRWTHTNVFDQSLSDVTCRCLSKEEIQLHKNEVLNLYQGIVSHLQKSPVFYPGTEFTDDVFFDCAMDELTKVFVAFEGDHMIGIIDTNDEGNSFINDDSFSCNIGDVYVLPEYRGKKIAQLLLQTVCSHLSSSGVTRAWVEHGTANPNARGFWDKYFTPYSYDMIRVVEPIK